MKENKPMENESVEEKDPEVSNNKRGRPKRFLIPILVLAVVAVAVFLYWYEFLRGYVGTDDAFIDSDPVTISPKMLGRIVNLNADEGDTVNAGELLVQIDDSDLRTQEAQAQANLELLQQSVLVTKIALNQAKDDYHRDSIQFQGNIITRQQFDRVTTALHMAKAQQAVAVGRVKTAQAQLAIIETQLENTKIYAPASGVVARKWVMPGDIIQPGQPVFTIYDLNDIWVTANFEETKLASISPGDKVEISIDAVPGRKFTGKVDQIGAAAASQFSLIPPNNASGNFTKVTQRIPIKILFVDPDNNAADKRVPILPGMSVEVKIRVMGK
jgi:membrane fusion protein (multidrug efflux system)